MLDVQNAHNTPIQTLLHKMYVIDDKSTQTIANELGVERDTINAWLVRVGIYSKRLEEYDGRS